MRRRAFSTPSALLRSVHASQELFYQAQAQIDTTLLSIPIELAGFFGRDRVNGLLSPQAQAWLMRKAEEEKAGNVLVVKMLKGYENCYRGDLAAMTPALREMLEVGQYCRDATDADVEAHNARRRKRRNRPIKGVRTLRRAALIHGLRRTDNRCTVEA